MIAFIFIGRYKNIMGIKFKMGLTENFGFLTGVTLAIIIIKYWLMPWMTLGEVVEYVLGLLVRIF